MFAPDMRISGPIRHFTDRVSNEFPGTAIVDHYWLAEQGRAALVFVRSLHFVVRLLWREGA